MRSRRLESRELKWFSTVGKTKGHFPRTLLKTGMVLVSQVSRKSNEQTVAGVLDPLTLLQNLIQDHPTLFRPKKTIPKVTPVVVILLLAVSVSRVQKHVKIDLVG